MEMQPSCPAHVWITFSFLLALNFFRQSTVSCLCIQEATVERCCGEKGGLRVKPVSRALQVVSLHRCGWHLPQMRRADLYSQGCEIAMLVQGESSQSRSVCMPCVIEPRRSIVGSAWSDVTLIVPRTPHHQIMGMSQPSKLGMLLGLQTPLGD